LGSGLTRPPGVAQAIGDCVPRLELPVVGGGTLALEARLTGRRGALVVFWSGICSHCVRYDAFFNSFETRHPEIALLAVAARRGETLEQLQRVIAERDLRFPILHSTDGAAARAWYAQQTPRCYLVDPQLRLLYRGAIDNYKYAHAPDYEAYLEPAIEAFLANRPIARPDTPAFGCAIDSIYYLLPRPR
jgi:peroxiredoxin